MVSFMTLQNSMDERKKKKNYQAFDHTLLSSMTVCVSRAGPVCVWCEVSGWGGSGCLLSLTERERERSASLRTHTHSHTFGPHTL